jgi:hypothetical protein
MSVFGPRKLPHSYLTFHVIQILGILLVPIQSIFSDRFASGSSVPDAPIFQIVPPVVWRAALGGALGNTKVGNIPEWTSCKRYDHEIGCVFELRMSIDR